MQNKNNISDNLPENAPFLSKIEKENHFSTPKNYFESFPQVIGVKIQNNSKIRFYFDKLSYRYLVPTSAFLVITLLLFIWNSPGETTTLSGEQISEIVIEENYIGIDEDLIFDTYSEILETEKTKSTSAENEEYINYLLENDIDINTIISEL